MSNAISPRPRAVGVVKRHFTIVASQYNAACLRAMTSAVIRATDMSPTGAEKADAEADRAMAWLKKAVADGFKNAAHMQKDPGLASLRDRPDFQKLIAELQARD